MPNFLFGLFLGQAVSCWAFNAPWPLIVFNIFWALLIGGKPLNEFLDWCILKQLQYSTWRWAQRERRKYRKVS